MYHSSIKTIATVGFLLPTDVDMLRNSAKFSYKLAEFLNVLIRRAGHVALRRRGGRRRRGRRGAAALRLQGPVALAVPGLQGPVALSEARLLALAGVRARRPSEATEPIIILQLLKLFAKFWQTLPNVKGFLLGYIEADCCTKICVLQHCSSSTELVIKP